MKNSERLAQQLSWITLIALALLAGWEGLLDLPMLMVFGIAIIGYGVIPLIRFAHKIWTLLIFDSLIAVALIFFSGGPAASLIWAGLLPVIGISVRKGLLASLGVVLGLFFLLFLTTFSTISFGELLEIVSLPLLTILFVGLISAFLSNQLALHSIQSLTIERNRVEEAARLERERKQSMFEVSETLSTALDFDQVLELALDLIDSSINENVAERNNLHSAVLLVSDGGFRLAAARRHSYADLELTFKGKTGVLAKVVAEGQAQLIEHPERDEELARISIIDTSNVALCCPLNAGLDLFGLLLITHEKIDYFSNDRMVQIEAIAQQLSSALRNAQLYDSLEYEKERISHIEEQARRQLARNLHDGPAQSIAAIAMRVNLARRLLEKDVSAASDELFRVEELARRTTKEIRHMLFTLRPEILEKDGFAAAIYDLSEKIEDRYQRSIQLDLDAKAVKKMDLGRQGVLFNVAVEGLSNAVKHAEAENIRLRLKEFERDIAYIEIVDDGKGFVPFSEENRAMHADQSGLRNMQDRIELLNGLLRIESEAGKGSNIQIWIPMNEKAAAKLRQRLDI